MQNLGQLPEVTFAAFNDFDSQMCFLGGPIGCVSGDTEYLTKSGWKRIDEYDGEGEIAEYSLDTGQAEYRIPKGFIKKPESSWYNISSYHGPDMMLSPEHTVLFDKKYKPGNWLTSTPSEIYENSLHLKEGWDGRIPTVFLPPERKGIDLSDDELRLMVAVCADGSFSSTTTTPRCRMSFRKDRKKKRLELLLDKCGIDFIVAQRKSEPREVRYSFNAPQRNKSLAEYWPANSDQIKIIFEEAVFWDGHYDVYGAYRFYSIHKDEADFFQYVAASMGRYSSITIDKAQGNWSECYTVTAGVTNPARRTASVEKIERLENKYCFETTSGYWIARRNNRIFVTGNTGKTYVHIGYKMLGLMTHQRPYRGIRRTRFLVSRAVKGDLEKSIFNELHDDILPEEWIVSASRGYPMSINIDGNLGDGTRVKCEIQFYAFPDLDSVDKVRSIGYTAIFMLETQEFESELIVLGQYKRGGRYPTSKDGGICYQVPQADGTVKEYTGNRLYGDFNYPRRSHWLYKFLVTNNEPVVFDKNVIPARTVYEQPPIFNFTPSVDGPHEYKGEKGEFIPNPDAANYTLHYSEHGPDEKPKANFRYWIDILVQLLMDRDDSSIERDLLGQWGTIVGGKPVHPRYRIAIHQSVKALEYDPTLLVLCGVDNGFNNAWTFWQVGRDGVLYGIHEICNVGENAKTIAEAVEDDVIPYVRGELPHDDVLFLPDRHFADRSGGRGDSQLEPLQEAGFKFKLAKTDKKTSLIAAANLFLTGERMVLSKRWKCLTRHWAAVIITKRCVPRPTTKKNPTRMNTLTLPNRCSSCAITCGTVAA